MHLTRRNNSITAPLVSQTHSHRGQGSSKVRQRPSGQQTTIKSNCNFRNEFLRYKSSQMYLVRKNFRFIFSFKNKKKFQKLKNVYRYKIYVWRDRRLLKLNCWLKRCWLFAVMYVNFSQIDMTDTLPSRCLPLPPLLE